MSRMNVKKGLLLGFLLLSSLTSAQAATQPKFEIIPTTPTTVILPITSTTTVQYRVTNRTKLTRTLTMVPIAGITPDTSGTGYCGNPFTLAPNESCLLTLPIVPANFSRNLIYGGPIVCKTQGPGNNAPDPFLCSQASQANSLRAILLVYISASPEELYFVQNSTGTVTITDISNSLLPATNIRATIPAGSSIFVQSNNCPERLPVGSSCTIVFGATAGEGPTTVQISGDYTNTINLPVTVVNQPVISITAPGANQRIIPVNGGDLPLTISNDTSSPVNAEDVTVTGQASCPGVVFDDTDCMSIAPGASCTLLLSSPTPYTPCSITVSGSNTANSPSTTVAFSVPINNISGLVFDTNGTTKAVYAPELQTRWTSTFANTGADSTTDGDANTDDIIGNASCSNDPDNCAAQRCRDFGANWYLPALNELSTVASVFCPTGTSCNFIQYSSGVGQWSSTQNLSFNQTQSANFVFFPSGQTSFTDKDFPLRAHCIGTSP